METFIKLFGSPAGFSDRCFDGIVILGHLPLLTRPENIVIFSGMCIRSARLRRMFRAGAPASTTVGWMHSPVRSAFRLNAEKGVRKEDYVRFYLQRMERQNRLGVYFILKSMEVGPPSAPPCHARNRGDLLCDRETLGHAPSQKLKERMQDL